MLLLLLLLIPSEPPALLSIAGTAFVQHVCDPSTAHCRACFSIHVM
jgi:hypothetical protein